MTFYDGVGYKAGTFISPTYLKEFFLSRHRQFIRAVHSTGKPAIIHSCGKIDAIMGDLIEYYGYDAKHSFEDQHSPIRQTKLLWGIGSPCLAVWTWTSSPGESPPRFEAM